MLILYLEPLKPPRIAIFVGRRGLLILRGLQIEKETRVVHTTSVQNATNFLFSKLYEEMIRETPDASANASSKLQISGPEKRIPRGLHYVCRLGKCGFYAVARSGDSQLTVDKDLVDLLIQRLVI